MIPNKDAFLTSKFFDFFRTAIQSSVITFEHSELNSTIPNSVSLERPVKIQSAPTTFVSSYIERTEVIGISLGEIKFIEETDQCSLVKLLDFQKTFPDAASCRL